MSETEFDAIVVGAGPSGEVCAGRLGEAGWEVAILEQHLVGGECSYYACMPSKSLLRPADVFAEAGRVPGVAETLGGELDGAAILRRRDEVIHDLNDSGQLPWLKERGVKLFRGEGRLDGERRVRIAEQTLTARRAIIVATGSGASMPPIDGLDQVDAWNNREGTTSKEVPQSLIVLGGGPVGCELAQAWSSLGTAVTLIEGAERLISREEPFAAEEVAASLQEQYGVDLRIGVLAERVNKEDGAVSVELSDGSSARAAEILVAVGRRPRTEGLGLESAGVSLKRGGILATDQRLRVEGRDWLYAIGDVNGRAPFTHMGKYQAWVATENLLGRGVEAIAEEIGSPRVTFTDPQVAAVGKGLEQAREAGIDAKTIDVATDASPGASFQGRGTGGTSRLVIDRSNEAIVGATFTGFETADFLHAATIAILTEVPLGRLRHAIAAYPTRSEVWLKLLETAGL